MTKAEWMATTNPKPMLEILREAASERKSRLFAVACCRQVWEQLPDLRSRAAVEIAEQFADEAVTADDLRACRRAALQALAERGKQAPDDRFRFVLLAASDAACPNAWDAASMMPCDAAWPTTDETPDRFFNDSVLAVQAGLIRDVFRNPFTLPDFPSTWISSMVLSLAQGIYAQRAFDRMPILADALQDAGCENDEVLDHCRQPGEHVRGCWLVDLILGKT